MNIFITGTSQGIGLELTKQALTQGHEVMALARNPEGSEGLMTLKKTFDNLHILKLDLDQKDAPEKIWESLKNWKSLDLVINNAGIYEKDETPEQFHKSFQTNTITPYFVTKALLPLLQKSSHPKNINISSQMGSIEDNRSGSAYSYRASKAALNMIIKGLSVDYDWLTSIVVHPGWVQTRMGGKEAPTQIHDSVSGLWELINGLKKDQSGLFFDYRGHKLPW